MLIQLLNDDYEFMLKTFVWFLKWREGGSSFSFELFVLIFLFPSWREEGSSCSVDFYLSIHYHVWSLHLHNPSLYKIRKQSISLQDQDIDISVCEGYWTRLPRGDVHSKLMMTRALVMTPTHGYFALMVTLTHDDSCTHGYSCTRGDSHSWWLMHSGWLSLMVLMHSWWLSLMVTLTHGNSDIFNKLWI